MPPSLVFRPDPGERPRVVRVAAAADLKFALRDVCQEFEGVHPDITVEVSDGASGNFFAQIQNGAPFDLFLSADMDYPRRLVKDGLADGASEFTYAVGHLVVWVPNDSPLDVEKLGAKALLDPSVHKVLTREDFHVSDYSPWEGWEVAGWPVVTILRGRVIVERGRLAGGALAGRLVPRKIDRAVLERQAC